MFTEIQTPHIVLLGDSIFDNRVYVPGGPDVVTQLREQLPQGWKASLCAVDGHVTRDVPRQLEMVNGEATHLVVSVGGNDALQSADVLMRGVGSVAEAMGVLANVVEKFECDYRCVLRDVVSRHLPTTVCTIYNPRFEDPFQQRVCVAALCLFNDAIIRTACRFGVPVLDLRQICTEYADYANDIEPGVPGGRKIVRGILRVLNEHDFSKSRTAIYC
jgi:hypothetical protein